MSDSQWTSDPPEREGWYWVRYSWGEVSEDPHSFTRRGVEERWEYWDPWEMISVGNWWTSDQRDWLPWTGEYQRSVEPLTPPEPPK